ncbi:response regulator receiver protein [Cylindrospermum sp. NIES-4074]|nr:response regulator receiver protein [Cylindrospermum sp. NIES-4074]
MPLFFKVLELQEDNIMLTQSICLDGLRLLVVDDDADTREILTFLFEMEGAEIKSVGSANEALELISNFKPDILISDIHLPDEDGCSLLPKVRNLEVEKGRWIPAIALTGSVMEEDRAEAFSAGFQKYLCKPINLDELISVVANLARGNLFAGSLQTC